MFIYEYYFGQRKIVTFMRIFMGPVLTFIGFGLYTDASDRFGIAYGGFCIAYGLYYILKPILWILFRWNSFKKVDFEIDVTPDKLIIKEELNDSQINYLAFKNIFKRRTYYVFATDNNQKIYIPISSLDKESHEILNEKITK
jgi:hypothetical protein